MCIEVIMNMQKLLYPIFNGKDVKLCINNENCIYKDCGENICPIKIINYQNQICIDIHHIKLLLRFITGLFLLVVIRKIYVSINDEAKI